METRHKVEQVKAHLNAKNPLHDAAKEENEFRLARGKSWMGGIEQLIQHVCDLTELKQVKDWEKYLVKFKLYYETATREPRHALPSQGTSLVGGSQSSRMERLYTETVEPTES